MGESSNNIAKLKVVGVGGAGGNAINDMIESNITDVEFIAVNTDAQDLARSLTETRVLLGKGLGAGADPEKARIAAKESEEKIRDMLEDTDMLFITAGMGGGTGTGASPIVAEIAKSMGILTVAVVTKPFEFEGPLKKKNAELGIENLKQNVDTLIAIPNEKLFELPNVSNSGIAMLGFGEASGDGKAKTATEQALNSPLLENSIEGARKVLLNITAGGDIGLHEIREVSETVSHKTGNAGASLIWGVIIDPELEGTIRVSIIATDFQDRYNKSLEGTVFGGIENFENDSEKADGEEGKLLKSDSENHPTQFVVPSFFSKDE